MNVPPGASGPEPALAPAGPSLDERIAEALNLLGKSIRAYRMYQANNPVYQRFLDGLRAAFTGIWASAPELRFTVEEHGLVRDGKRYPVGEGRDDLAFQFFKDGIRYVTFLPGFENELERFLELVHEARLLAIDEEDDLVTLLWEQDFSAFQYGYIDVLAEGIEIPDAPGEPELEAIPRDQIGADAAVQGAPEGAAFTREDFKDTLYFLEEDELQALRTELENEWARELKQDVLYALFDRLEDPMPERQAEVVSILRQLLPAYLGRGHLGSAAMILRELEALRQRDGLLGPDQQYEIDQLMEEMSDPAVLGQLIQSLENGGIQVGPEHLSALLMRLRPRALPVLLRAVETTTIPEVHERLAQAIDHVAGQYTGYVVDLLRAPDETVAMGAARVAGRLRISRATRDLARLLERADPVGRTVVLEALLAIRSAESLGAAQQALRDPVREVRIAAARGLGAIHYQPAGQPLEALIDGRALRSADLTEKLAIFDAYAAITGADGVPLLDRILNARGKLGRREPPEIRACAATALGRVATPAARAALEGAAHEPDPVVRSAVVRALRHEASAP